VIDLIKRLFSSREESAITIQVGSLREWQDSKEKEAEAERQIALSHAKARAQEILDEIKNSVETLRTAKLINPKITTREFQFMEGNRNFYIQRTEMLTKQIEGTATEGADSFIKLNHAALNDFSASTLRSFQVLQQYFEHETRPVVSHIAELGRTIQELDKRIHSEKYPQLESIGRDIAAFFNNEKRKKELADDIVKIHEEQAANAKELEQLESQKQALLDSPDFEEYAKLAKEKEHSQQNLKNMEDGLNAEFCSLERPLRKYARISLDHETLAAAYSEDPLAALMKDAGLKILQVIADMQGLLAKGKLELKEKETAKVLKQLGSLDRAYFESIKNNYEKETAENQRLEAAILASHAKKQLDGLEIRLEENQGLKHSLDEKEKNLKLKHESINLASDREKIERQIGQLLKKKINIAL